MCRKGHWNLSRTSWSEFIDRDSVAQLFFCQVRELRVELEAKESQNQELMAIAEHVRAQAAATRTRAAVSREFCVELEPGGESGVVCGEGRRAAPCGWCSEFVTFGKHGFELAAGHSKKSILGQGICLGLIHSRVCGWFRWKSQTIPNTFLLLPPSFWFQRSMRSIDSFDALRREIYARPTHVLCRKMPESMLRS